MAGPYGHPMCFMLQNHTPDGGTIDTPCQTAIGREVKAKVNLPPGTDDIPVFTPAR